MMNRFQKVDSDLEKTFKVDHTIIIYLIILTTDQ